MPAGKGRKVYSHSRRSFSREHQKLRIIAMFAIEIQHGRTEHLTVNQIARKLDMARSSHLTKILLEMVEEGKLTFVLVQSGSKWTGRAYFLKEGTFDYPQPRQIPINVMGEAKGQLTLW